MKITQDDVSRVTSQIIKLVNKYKRLDSKALDFGTGDLLYPSEIHVIEAIGKNLGNTVNDLCQRFSVTKGAISQIVNKLTAKRLVIKKRNPDYHKEVILTLTERGRKAFDGHERLHAFMDKKLYGTMMNINRDELKNFEDILQIIESYIERYIAFGEGK